MLNGPRLLWVSRSRPQPRPAQSGAAMSAFTTRSTHWGEECCARRSRAQRCQGPALCRLASAHPSPPSARAKVRSAGAGGSPRLRSRHSPCAHPLSRRGDRGTAAGTRHPVRRPSPGGPCAVCACECAGHTCSLGWADLGRSMETPDSSTRGLDTRRGRRLLGSCHHRRPITCH